MNINRSIGTSGRSFLAVFLSLLLMLPGAAMADGKNGKKNFKEGLKYEQLQQWDIAAQKFALALQAEPNNPEYKVHYLQALSRASLMYITRGDALAEQNDYQGAYVAYRQAFSLDPGNEISKFKMERMLELQKAQASGAAEQVKYNTRTGAVQPVNREIQLANKRRARGDIADNIKFAGTPFKQAIKSLSDPLNLNVVFDDSVRNDPVTVDLKEVTVATALDIVLMQKKCAFEQVDRRTIFIYPDNTANRPRFEKLLIKTFYLNNISAQTVKNVLAQMLPAGRQAATVDTLGGASGASTGSNVLIVKATPAELQLVQDLIVNIDKNKNEVVLDIEIYEVSNDSLVQIGNQFVTSPVQIPSTVTDADGNVTTVTTTSPSLSNLGGFGLGRLAQVAGDTVVGGNLFSPFLGGVGTLFGFPPSQLSLLQSKGKSKLLHKTQIHVLDGGENETKVGRSVPVRLGTSYPGSGYGGFGGLNGLGGLNNNGVNGNNGLGQNIGNALATLGGLGGFGGYGGFDSIQYRDVGLVIKAKPQITNEGYVEIKMNFESSEVQASGADVQNLTPTFTQRSLNTVARIQDGVTAVVAGVNQDTKGSSRSGLPVIGMLPLVGRLFATPRQESRQTDVIITVTPHIVRSAGITADDYLAHIGPPAQGGMNQSIEDVINRAQIAEEEEQRLIAQQQAPSQQLAPVAGAPAQNTQTANFNNQQRPNVTQPAGYNSQPVPGATVQPASNTNAPNNSASFTGSGVGLTPPPSPEKTADSSLNRPGALEPASASARSEIVDRAVSKILAEGKSEANSTVNFSLSAKSIKERVGKSFTVTIDVSGERQMSGADIALKYDASMLQVKSVRDGGLFGQQPDFSYDKKQKGVLTVSVKHPYDAPTATRGRLVMVEFSAIGEGQSEIALSGDQTRARVGAAQIPVAGSAVQVVIGGRDSAQSSTEK
ncbi:MAG TPA: cohesin domain-containing protein [Blastocatellia bacterium]|nr:cohesin domain-containing protein [Blastocatellia bacterium]